MASKNLSQFSIFKTGQDKALVLGAEAQRVPNQIMDEDGVPLQNLVLGNRIITSYCQPRLSKHAVSMIGS